MLRSLIIPAAMIIAGAGLVSASTAEAATPTCTCVKAKKVKKTRRHVTHVVRRAAPRSPVVIETSYDANATTAMYYAPDSGHLPDPWRTTAVWSVNADEKAVADDLLKTIDLFRVCGWTNSEHAAAVFITWSRTHSMEDRMRVGTTQTAESAYTRISAYRQRDMAYPPHREEFCRNANAEYPDLKARLDSQTEALTRAHAIVHH